MIINVKRMRNLKVISVGIGMLFMISSCKTYTITTDSFREQMRTATSENRKEVEINNPLFYKKITYSTNNISQLIVWDKKGNKMHLQSSPAIEMRVTHSNGKKYHFYFDTVIMENEFLKWGRSRFLKERRGSIPMDSIVKIEVQDGGKKFKYQY